MSSPIPVWHDIITHKNRSAIEALLAQDVVMHSPVVHTPLRGKPIVVTYLDAAFSVFLNDSFHYVRSVVDKNQAVLEFMVEIDGIVVNGVDMIAWNEIGQITDFKVMLRPLKAIELIHQKMQTVLKAPRV